MILRFWMLFFLMLSVSAWAEDKFWIQLMPNNQVWLRLLTADEKCPSVTMDGVEREMRSHSQKSNAMEITSCKTHVPKGVNEIKVHDKVLSMPTTHKKIVVIGDTGCRLKGAYSQNCKTDWPFAEVAELAYQHHPDLVIHLGDYLYREFCTSAECVDESSGDNWQAWHDDFFQPAGNLLNAAPWVIARGNHESCDRGGAGWSSFFDYRKKCHKHTPPYSIDLSEDLRLIIADSGEGNLSQETMNKINDIAHGKRSWLITHRPLWADEIKGINHEYKPSDLASTINAIFSGHVHILQLSEVDGKLQVIAGNSGAALYSTEKFSAQNTKVGFGYIALDKQENNSWKLRAFNLKNEIIASRIIN